MPPDAAGTAMEAVHKILYKPEKVVYSILHFIL